MINKDKFTEKRPPTQVAGLLPEDSNIEFYAVTENKRVVWLQNGRTLDWHYLPEWIFKLCKNQYKKDIKAVEDLSQITTNLNRQVELYVYYLYGDLDCTADILNGQLTASENFRETKNDASLSWNYKHITMGEAILTQRDIQIIDMILENLPDKAIASKMNIAHSTFDFHKRNLFKRANVGNKQELIIAAFNHHV